MPIVLSCPMSCNVVGEVGAMGSVYCSGPGRYTALSCRTRLRRPRGIYERSSLRRRRVSPPPFRRASSRRRTSASLYVSAWDQKTRAPITGLGVDAFSVREDGARREVLRVTPATSPMPVAILVDNSQAARNHISEIRRALTSFVRALDGLGPISIIGIADRPTILTRLHHRPEAARRRHRQGVRDAGLGRDAARRDRRGQQGPRSAAKRIASRWSC